MIKTIEIKNFKSIKHLKLGCKRINILIGEPNTGKSNILESLGVLCYGGHFAYAQFGDFVRFEKMTDLFYDELLDEPLAVLYEGLNFTLAFEQGSFHGEGYSGNNRIIDLMGGYEGLRHTGGNGVPALKYYKFAVRQSYPRTEAEYLLPPYGQNLMSLILAHKQLRQSANDIFSRFGLELNLRPQEGKIEILKRLEGVTVSYPYSLTSDTLQRTVFNLFAVISNRDSMIALEEPESHAFPYYTKYFAETVALDDRNNQYFITTHNPYLLLPILEKAPKDDVAVFITYFRDYQTKVKPLSPEEMQELTEIDVFSNLDRFLEEK